MKPVSGIKNWLDRKDEGGMILGACLLAHQLSGWPLWLIRLYNLAGLLLLPIPSIILYLVGAWVMPQTRPQTQRILSDLAGIGRKLMRLIGIYSRRILSKAS